MTKNKTAKLSVFSKKYQELNGKYPCKFPWPEDCFCQCGDSGIVFDSKNKTSYRTSFFEAFPKDPKTFLRGEGSSLEKAEEAAWNKLQKYKNCPGHEFERRDYRNGAGFCKHCGLFKSKAFEPLERCHTCSKPTYDRKGKDGNWYCEDHGRDQMPDFMKEMLEFEDSLKEKSKKTGKSIDVLKKESLVRGLSALAKTIEKKEDVISSSSDEMNNFCVLTEEEYEAAVNYLNEPPKVNEALLKTLLEAKKAQEEEKAAKKTDKE